MYFLFTTSCVCTSLVQRVPYEDTQEETTVNPNILATSQ